jgi:uncharacterized NAD-dependent epimerase/dehydratase family protein
VVCHDPGRTHIDGYPDFPLPTIEACIEATLRAARLTNPGVRCAGIALDTSRTPATERAALLAATADRVGVPAFDPIATGASGVVEALLAGA